MRVAKLTRDEERKEVEREENVRSNEKKERKKEEVPGIN